MPRQAGGAVTIGSSERQAGLCACCRHCRLVDSGRSVFYLCGRSLTDPSFRKYPPLPVLVCRGFEEPPPEPSRDDEPPTT